MNNKSDAEIINPSSRITLKDQVKNYLFNLIKRNRFKVDEKLPTMRELATQLNVSKRTVENAILELDRLGMVYRRVGRGTFVKEQNPSRSHLLANPGTVLVAVPNLVNPHFSSFISEVEQGLFQSGNRVMTASMLLLETEQKKYIRMMEEENFDGIIALAAT